MEYTAAQLILHQFRRNLRDYGIRVALLKAILRLSRFIYDIRVYVIYHVVLGLCQTYAGVESGLAYQFLQPEEDGLIAQIEDTEEWLNNRLGFQIRHGGLCLVALDGQRVVGFNLVSFGRVEIPLIETELGLNTHSAWSEQITVIRNFRGCGIASELRYRMFNELKSKGYH